MRRTLVRALLVTLLTCGGVALGASDPAGAMCKPNRVLLTVPGAAEDTRTGTNATCDLDNIYLGRVSDTATDGFCATIAFQDAGFGGFQGTDCTNNGSWSNYSFTDTGGGNGATYTLCGSVCNIPTATWGY